MSSVSSDHAVLASVERPAASNLGMKRYPRLRRYLAILWIALWGEPGYCIVKEADYLAFMRRSQAGKRSHETRKAKKVGFQIADTGSF